MYFPNFGFVVFISNVNYFNLKADDMINTNPFD